MKNWLDDLVDSSPAARHIAWAGEVSFLSAREDDRTGRVVQLALHREKKELATAHPFSAHTRRRRGHAGTLFEASFAGIDGGQDFAGPVMLLNWGATPKGETVTLLLNYEQDKHPFLACNRAAKDQPATRWMAVFVETDEQSAPVDQKQRRRVEGAFGDLSPDPAVEGQSVCMVCRKSPVERCICDVPAKKSRKPKQQIKNSNLAAQFIKNERFHKFLAAEYGLCLSRVAPDRDSDQFIKDRCQITSKADLDRDQNAADEFDTLREEFVSWQQQKGYDLTN